MHETILNMTYLGFGSPGSAACQPWFLSTLRLSRLEPSGHLGLEDTLRIISRRHLLNVLDVLIAVPTERVLRLVGIVEVDVLIEFAN